MCLFSAPTLSHNGLWRKSPTTQKLWGCTEDIQTNLTLEFTADSLNVYHITLNNGRAGMLQLDDISLTTRIY